MQKQFSVLFNPNVQSNRVSFTSSYRLLWRCTFVLVFALQSFWHCFELMSDLTLFEFCASVCASKAVYLCWSFYGLWFFVIFMPISSYLSISSSLQWYLSLYLFDFDILFHQSSHRSLTFSYLLIFHKVVTKGITCTNLSIFQFDPIHSFVELFIWSQTFLKHLKQRDK